MLIAVSQGKGLSIPALVSPSNDRVSLNDLALLRKESGIVLKGI